MIMYKYGIIRCKCKVKCKLCEIPIQVLSLFINVIILLIICRMFPFVDGHTYTLFIA